MIGALAVILASFLPWLSSQGGTPAANAFDVPFRFLIDPTQATGVDLDLGFAVLVIGLGAGAATVVPALSTIRRLLGLAAIAIGVVFFGQLARLVDQVGADMSVTDLVGFGVYLAVGGGVLLLFAKGK